MELFAFFSPRQPNPADSPKTEKRLTVRQVCVLLHRYVGLAIAIFLIIAGLTGSLLTFYHELDTTISPHLYRVAPPASSADQLAQKSLAMSASISACSITATNR